MSLPNNPLSTDTSTASQQSVRPPRRATLVSAAKLCHNTSLFESAGNGRFRQIATHAQLGEFEQRNPESVGERLDRLGKHHSPTQPGQPLVERLKDRTFVIDLDGIEKILSLRNAGSNVVQLSSRARQVAQQLSAAGYQRTGTGEDSGFIHAETNQPLTLAESAEINGWKSLGTSQYWDKKLASGTSPHLVDVSTPAPVDPVPLPGAGQSAPWDAAAAAFAALCACENPTDRHFEAFDQLVDMCRGFATETPTFATETPSNPGFREVQSRETPRGSSSTTDNDDDNENQSSHIPESREQNPETPDANPFPWKASEFAAIIRPYQKQWAQTHSRQIPRIDMPASIGKISADQLRYCIEKLLENTEEHKKPGGLLHDIIRSRNPHYLPLGPHAQVEPSSPIVTAPCVVRLDDLRSLTPEIMVDTLVHRCTESNEFSATLFVQAWADLVPLVNSEIMDEAASYVSAMHYRLLPQFEQGIESSTPRFTPPPSTPVASGDF